MTGIVTRLIKVMISHLENDLLYHKILNRSLHKTTVGCVKNLTYELQVWIVVWDLMKTAPGKIHDSYHQLEIVN